MLYYGMLEPTEENLGGEWGAENLEMDLQWTRQPFWEGPETPLPLSNTSAANDTDGITVNNVNDSNGENWVDIRGLDIEGDLPSAIKVQMYNAYASAAPADEIILPLRRSRTSWRRRTAPARMLRSARKARPDPRMTSMPRLPGLPQTRSRYSRSRSQAQCWAAREVVVSGSLPVSIQPLLIRICSCASTWRAPRPS